ncbi:MAG TPA: response regulator [Ohtaekwangia sp.]
MTILLVNDDRNQQEMFHEIVRRIDPEYTCLKSFSTESALAFLQDKDSVLPDLIFLDLVFRANGGKQMLKTLKESKALQYIPVCIYTDSANQSDRDETHNLGAIGYILKQQNFTSLSDSIRTIIASAADTIH